MKWLKKEWPFYRYSNIPYAYPQDLKVSNAFYVFVFFFTFGKQFKMLMPEHLYNNVQKNNQTIIWENDKYKNITPKSHVVPSAPVSPKVLKWV